MLGYKWKMLLSDENQQNSKIILGFPLLLSKDRNISKGNRKIKNL